MSQIPALVRVFAYLSLLTVGGGMAAYPEMQYLAVDVHQWLTERQLIHLYSLGQMAPGPNMMMIVVIGDWAVVSAGSAVHQFCKVGSHAIIGGYSVITQDVLPYSMTVNEREVKVFGANATGLERRGFSPESIDALHKAFRLLTRSGLNTSQAVARIREEVPPAREIDELIAFIETSKRGVIK